MPTWQDQPERGSGTLTRFIVWLSLNTRRPLVRLLLYPITAYFFAFSPVMRAASRKYLSTVLRQSVSLRQVFHHYLTFARVSHDRILLLSGRHKEFDVSFKGLEVVEALLARNQGFLFLGAHLGSFEVLRAFGMFEKKMPIKILLYPDNTRRILAIIEALNPALSREIISLGKPESMILAKRHVDNGGIIGILGDRIARGDKVVYANFLGCPAEFPAGPMLLASFLKVPVVLFCGLYLGRDRYEIRFESFGDEIIISPDSRQQDLQAWIDRYAARLDQLCTTSPYNWFNFYDFWAPHQM
jgi:predicted LPLAT superfamily acyltransferase